MNRVAHQDAEKKLMEDIAHVPGTGKPLDSKELDASGRTAVFESGHGGHGKPTAGPHAAGGSASGGAAAGKRS